MQIGPTAWRFGIVVSTLVSINEANPTPGPVSIGMGDRVRVSTPAVPGNLSLYITSHSCQLSLAIPLWVDAMSTSQRAVMHCGWGVKAGMVCEWVAGKTV